MKHRTVFALTLTAAIFVAWLGVQAYHAMTRRVAPESGCHTGQPPADEGVPLSLPGDLETYMTESDSDGGSIAVGDASAAESSKPTATIWGYAGAQSVPQGGTIKLYVSTRAATYDLVIFRWGANGLEQQGRVNGLPGSWKTCPESHKGCGWSESYVLTIPAEWRSGLYIVKLLTPGESLTGQYGGWIYFVVRAAQPGSTARILYMAGENTWQAYNYTPEGGLSYYPDTAVGRGRASVLSFDRPYGGWGVYMCNLTGTCMPRRNLPLIQWLEQNGYAVEYASNYDVHSIPDLLSHYRLFINDAHDEYWSWEMRDQVEGFIARGGNAAFFGSNNSYWQVRYENNGRTLVGYKYEAHRDPIMKDGNPANDYLDTTSFCLAPASRCETSMTGVTYWNAGRAKPALCAPGRCSGGMVAWYPDHWVWTGTGVKQGQVFGAEDRNGDTVGIAAIEVDGALFSMTPAGPRITQSAINQGTPPTFQILGTMAASVGTGGTMGVYTNTMGATVWASGTWDWSMVGLAAHNPIVERVTRNVLDHLLAGELPGPEPTATATVPPDPNGDPTVTPTPTPTPTEVACVPGTITVTPDLDTYIRKGAATRPDDNAAAAAKRVRAADYYPVYKALVRFDLSALPATAHVSRARLRLELQEWDGSSQLTVAVLARAFDATATWTQASAAAAWRAAGASGAGTDYRLPIVRSKTVWGTNTIDVTALLSQGAPDGFLLSASGGGAGFASSESAAPPGLVVEYTCD